MIMTASAYPDTLLLIPLYNHAATLRGVVERAIQCDFAVLVVDDGSTDAGLQTLEGLPVLTIRLEKNRGKGAAILTGAKEAARRRYSKILTLDADGQHHPEEAHLLCREAEKHATPVIVIGARRMIQETVPRSSHFGRAFSNFWVHLECGRELSDTQSGMRLYPVKELLTLNLSRLRYDFEIEVLVKAVWAGVEVVTVDISVHYPIPEERISHFHKLKDNWRLTVLHTSLILRRFLPWPHKKLVNPGNLDAWGRTGSLSMKNPRQVLKKLCRAYNSPFWLATAVWVGIFLGTLPLIACHTVVILYVTHRLHLNKIAAVTASQFCAPPLVPALCIEVGYFLRQGEFLLDLSWERWLFEIHQRLWDWLIGSFLVGPLLAMIGWGLTFWGVKTLHRRRPLSLRGGDE